MLSVTAAWLGTGLGTRLASVAPGVRAVTGVTTTAFPGPAGDLAIVFDTEANALTPLEYKRRQSRRLI